MSRIIALDVGSKRTGIAETDPLQIIASGLKTLETSLVIPFLIDYTQKEKVETIVVGEPKRLHGEASQIEEFIAKFILKINQSLPNIKVVRVDERFTSKMAFQSLIDSGVKKSKRKEKGLVDEVSATLILQSYLTSIGR